MKLLIVVRITPASVGIRIPKDTVVLVADHEGDCHLSIILEEFLIAPLVVHLLRLMLTKPVESLVGITLEEGMPRISRAILKRQLVEVGLLAPVHLVGRCRAVVLGEFSLIGYILGECLPAVSLLKEHLACGLVDEGELASLLLHLGDDGGSLNSHHAVVLLDVGSIFALAVDHHKTLALLRDCIFGSSLHTDDVIADDGQPNCFSLFGFCGQRERDAPTLLLIACCP